MKISRRCTHRWSGLLCYLPDGHTGRHRAKETTATADAFVSWKELT